MRAFLGENKSRENILCEYMFKLNTLYCIVLQIGYALQQKRFTFCTEYLENMNRYPCIYVKQTERWCFGKIYINGSVSRDFLLLVFS
jgi:hypothetical protein